MHLKRTFKILNIKALAKCSHKGSTQTRGEMPLMRLVAITVILCVSVCVGVCVYVCVSVYEPALMRTKE